MPIGKIQSTCYPFGYDKNGASDRHDKRFAKGFNKWAAYIREANLLNASQSGMNITLEKAKNLIGL
jgi:hypothetical protein